MYFFSVKICNVFSTKQYNSKEKKLNVDMWCAVPVLPYSTARVSSLQDTAANQTEHAWTGRRMLQQHRTAPPLPPHARSRSRAPGVAVS